MKKTLKKLRKYILIVTVILICSFVHHWYPDMFSVFVFPIALTVLYEEISFTRITTFLCMLGMTPGVLDKLYEHGNNPGALAGAGMSYCFILVFGILSIITASVLIRRKKSLTELTELAENASRAKSDFLANMSHEIRTPMNAIVGMCELVLRDPDISENVRENCFGIQSSGRNLLYIVNDVLDFSKIESGKMEIIESEFNIASILNDVINMTVTRKGEKDIEIIVLADPDIPAGLLGDELRIRQIMINLMTNAVKYTNEGAVTLRVSKTTHQYGINLKFSVEDTGIGITKESLEKLFTSFQQVDTRKNRSVEGTGLGLAISKRLVTKMGGFINVKSTYGIGSVFSVVIPLKVSDEKPFIKVRDAENISAIAYTDMKKFKVPAVSQKYRELIEDLSDKLNIKVKYSGNIDQVKEYMNSRNKITHIFVGKEEYLSDKEYFSSISRDVQVVVIQDIVNSIRPGDNIKCIYKPFYTLSLAAVLNNESMSVNINDRRNSQVTFSAPKARILIVDDNEVNLKVAVGLMRPYHMQFITAGNARDAISLLRSKDIDLVLMDHMMPEMDGVEATKIIRSMEDDYYKKLPVIALTANAVNGARKMFIESGFNDFIAKPIELNTLDKCLKRWLPQELLCPPVRSVLAGGRRKSDPAGGRRAGGRMISVANGLNYTGGNEEAYFDILETFIRKIPEKRERIDRLAAEKDWKNYTIEVHAVKSSSLSVGCNILSEAAKELEQAGKSGDYEQIEKNNHVLSSMFSDVYEEGMNLLKVHGVSTENPASEKEEILPEISGEALEEIFIQASSACENFDSDMINELSEKASGYSYGGINLKSGFSQIKKLSDDFEYDKAHEVLNNLKKSIL
ncbi:MAG: ATP-binding protein [Oscillospiraceae bacterium]